MRYFGDREERHGAKLLKEIKAMFENMTKVFMDVKNVSIGFCHCYYFDLDSILMLNIMFASFFLIFWDKYRKKTHEEQRQVVSPT